VETQERYIFVFYFCSILFRFDSTFLNKIIIKYWVTYHNSYIILEACAQYIDFIDRAQLLTKKGTLLEVKVITSNKIRSSSRTGWPLLNIYFSRLSFLYRCKRPLSDLTTRVTQSVSYLKQIY